MFKLGGEHIHNTLNNRLLEISDIGAICRPSAPRATQNDRDNGMDQYRLKTQANMETVWFDSQVPDG